VLFYLLGLFVLIRLNALTAKDDLSMVHDPCLRPEILKGEVRGKVEIFCLKLFNMISLI
jgi:hypothetical protein